MLNAIQSEDTFLFLHIDKRIDLDLFLKQMGSIPVKNLILLPRFKSSWGSVGLAWASMAGIKSAMEKECDYVIFLSGSDYPIKSKQEIHSFLSKNEGKSYVDYYQMPAPFWIADKEINRIRKYYFFLNNKIFEYPLPPGSSGFPRKVLNFFLRFFLKKERKFPEGTIPFGGEHWVCLHNSACKAVIDFYDKHPDVLQFFTYCLSPEEIYIQTALFNTHDEKLTSSVENRTLTFINWKNKNNPSPVFFESDDFERIKSSDLLFARKFDFDKHPLLLEKINEELLNSDSSNKN